MFHESAETTQYAMRVMFLEHNVSVLQQELAFERASKCQTSENEATKVKEVEGIHKQLVQERVQHDAATKSLNAKILQLEQAFAKKSASVDSLQKELNLCRGEVDECMRQDSEKCHKMLEMEEELELLKCDMEEKQSEVNAMKNEIEQMKISKCVAEKKAAEFDSVLQADKELTMEIRKDLERERQKRLETEQELRLARANMQTELRSLYTKMESDVHIARISMETQERERRNQCESDWLSEKLRIEAILSAERSSRIIQEQAFMVEKTNFETALCSANQRIVGLEEELLTLKLREEQAIIEKNASQQQFNTFKLTMEKQVEQISAVVEQLKLEKEEALATIVKLEKETKKDDDDWEVVTD